MKEQLLNKVENIVREIAHYELFILLSQCFQKLSAADDSERLCVGQRVIHFPHIDIF